MVKGRVSETNERSLYDCYHARVRGDHIYCQKGHLFHNNGRQNGSISIKRLAKGAPLVMSICQECADFESMGDHVPCEERGWLDNTSQAGLHENRGELESVKPNKH
jgi:hypothetical protein